MALNLFSANNIELVAELQKKYREILDVMTVEIMPQNEQVALNVLIDGLISSNDRLLIITSEILNLRCKFRFLIEHFETRYCQQPYDQLDLTKLESIIKEFKPRVIIFDLLSFIHDPDWSELKHLARINGSSLVIKANEAINSGLIEEADFVTAQWGNGVIISKNSNKDFLEESRRNFFSPFFMINKQIIDFNQANLNAEVLCSALTFKLKNNRGSIVEFSYEEIPDRIENFKDILHQIGIEIEEANFKYKNLKTIIISTFGLTARGINQESFGQLGIIISKAYNCQRDIKKLEQLHDQVLNIERKI